MILLKSALRSLPKVSVQQEALLPPARHLDLVRGDCRHDPTAFPDSSQSGWAACHKDP